MASRAERIISWAAERGNAEAQAEVAERKRRRATRRERSAPRLAAKAGKRSTEKATEKANREAVMARADFRCERITSDPRDPPGQRGKPERCGMRATERDHFWGRARDESVEGSWALCTHCHRAKTENKPDRWYWLWSFYEHAKQRGYWVQQNKALDAMVLEKAQHPEHGRAA
jgi:5-methylcytosine-specific restriction endonuclease McrA